MEKLGCIYRWCNLVNGKCYYGQTMNVRRRYWQHLNGLRKNIHFNTYFQNVWNSCDGNDFRFEIVEENVPIEKLTEREQWWLDFTKCYLPQYGYNRSSYAEPITSITQKGRSKNPESSKKASKTMKLQFKNGRVTWNRGLTKEIDSRIREYGKKISLIQIGKVGHKKGKTFEKLYGKEEALRRKKLISEQTKGRVAWNKGLTGVYSKEVLENMSRVRKGRLSEKKGKTYEELYGIEKALELKNELKLCNVGHKLSPESIQKRSATQKKLRYIREQNRLMDQAFVNTVSM